jgi:hypothetical protein
VTRILIAGAPVGTGVVIGLEDRERSGWPARFATPGALVFSSVFSLVQLGLIAEYPGGSTGDARWALVATACYLPLHLHHVYWASRGIRPPAGVWTLLALAAVVSAAVPEAGANWLPVYAVVAVSAVLVLPWPWSLPVAAGVALAQAPLAHAVDSPLPDATTYYVFAVWWRASALFVPVWLLGAVRQLQATRRSLADEAVVRERLRIDGELRSTVGTALEAIATRGQRAVALIEDGENGGDGAGGAGVLEDEVRELVDGSRRALAQARQLINGYRQPALAAEVASAAALLTAAGIATRVELPPGGLPPAATADPAVRATLRAATAGVLHDDRARSCVIRVTWNGGRARLDVRSPGADPAGTDPADDVIDEVVR